MKIKYKLILIFTMIILTSSLPLAMYILHRQEADKISLVKHQGAINSRILASSIMNIILMNGGNVNASKVDSGDMISILKPLTTEGLVYADAILLSSQKKFNGLILASFTDKTAVVREVNTSQKMNAHDIDRLNYSTRVYESVWAPLGEECYEFSATAALPGKSPICIGRLIYSKSGILAPFVQLRTIMYGVIAFAVIAVGFVGIFFSRLLSKPIEELTAGVERIESGDLNFQVVVSSKDEFAKLAKTFNDMLKILNLEITELVNANKELTRLDNLKDEFLANISHELRSPLYGTIGMAESLIDGAAGPVNEELKHDLSMIVASARRLSRLLDDILDFSKLKHRDITLKRTPVDLHAIVKLVVSYLRSPIEKKQLKIVNLIKPQSMYVFGDEERIQQIMLYLMTNAVKFTESGEIIITSEESRDESDKILITIEDTGIGIPPDKMDRIFEVFEQGDGSINRSYGGAGLGLAISKKLVELHGGRIWAESEVGKGSKFYLTLKSCPDFIQHFSREKKKAIEMDEVTDFSFEEIRTHKKVIDAEHNEKEKKRILVVDDEPVNLQVMINHLTLEGYDVVSSPNGPDALKKIDEGIPFDLILLDVMMPRMSGYEVCRIIREKYSLQDLPVLMLTAKNKVEDVKAGLEAGANDYLTKPVNKEELIARVSSLISLKTSVQFHNELNIIKRDIFIAHEIQQSLLPQSMPDLDGFTIAARYEPMYDLGGDFYEFLVVDRHRVGILIADVSGHGIPAAFISSMLKVTYFFYKDFVQEPAVLMEKVNTTMCNYTNNQFITACYAYIDLDAGVMLQSNAGHWPLLVWRENEGQLIKEKSKDMPVGWLPEGKYEVITSDIKPGDRIVFYTDGLIETRNSMGEMFSDKRLHELLRNSRGSTPEEFIAIMLDEARAWSELAPGDSFKDDVTLIVVDISAPVESTVKTV